MYSGDERAEDLYHCTCPHGGHQFGLPPAKKYSNSYILIMSGEVYGSKLYWMKINKVHKECNFKSL
jgi:hypothetical protein